MASNFKRTDETQMKHIAPKLKEKSFHCPNCGVLAEQTWTRSVNGNYLRTNPNGQQVSEIFLLANYSVENVRIAKISLFG